MAGTTPSAAEAKADEKQATPFGSDPMDAVMAKYDRNGDGNFDVAEVRSIVQDVLAQQSMNKVLRKMIWVLVLIVVLTLFAMFGVSLAAGEALKNSKVEGSVMQSLDGKTMQVDTIETVKTLWDTGSTSTNALAKMKSITFYMDLTTDPATQAWVDATFKIAGAYKATADVANLKTVSGEKVTIRATAQTGEIVMDGKTYPIAAALPTGARRLDAKLDNPRKLNAFGGSLMTSGSFTMMSGSGV